MYDTHVSESIMNPCPECDGVLLPVGDNPPKDENKPYRVKCTKCDYTDVYGI